MLQRGANAVVVCYYALLCLYYVAVLTASSAVGVLTSYN